MHEFTRFHFQHSVKKAISDETFNVLDSLIHTNLLAEVREVPEMMCAISQFPEEAQPELLAKALLLPCATALACLTRDDESGGGLMMKPLLSHLCPTSTTVAPNLSDNFPELISLSLKHIHVVLKNADNFALAVPSEDLVAAVEFFTCPIAEAEQGKGLPLDEEVRRWFQAITVADRCRSSAWYKLVARLREPILH